MTNKLQVKLKIHHYRGIGPNLKIYLNNQLLIDYNNICVNEHIIEIPLENLKEINYFFIEHHGKNPNDALYEHHQTIADIAIEIEEIRFDNLLLDKNIMFDQFFFPQWKYDDRAPSRMTMNCYLWYNGIWQLIFPKNYTNWILEQIESNFFTSDTNKISVATLDLEEFKKDFF